MIESLYRDFVLGIRGLRNSPVFCLTAIVTIAIGIGANTAIFTLLYGLLLRSLPAKDPAQLARIGVLWDPATGFTQLRAIEAVATLMNLKLEIVEVRAVAELEEAMAAASRNNPDALVMLSTPIIGGSYKPLADFTLRRRLPAVTLFPDFARSGGLMGYGPNIHNGYLQTARMVAKVLRGTKPADLPVELPTKFELVVNLKAAKAIGVELPTSILLRADEVIE